MTGRRVGHVVSSWPQQGGVADVIKALVSAASDEGDSAEVFAWPNTTSRIGLIAKLRRFPPGLRAALPTLDALVLHGVFTPGRPCGWLPFPMMPMTPASSPRGPLSRALIGMPSNVGILLGWT